MRRGRRGSRASSFAPAPMWVPGKGGGEKKSFERRGGRGGTRLYFHNHFYFQIGWGGEKRGGKILEGGKKKEIERIV